MSKVIEVEIAPGVFASADGITMHSDGTYTIEWCGQKIERIQPEAFNELADTCAAIISGNVEGVDIDKLTSEVSA